MTTPRRSILVGAIALASVSLVALALCLGDDAAPEELSFVPGAGKTALVPVAGAPGHKVEVDRYGSPVRLVPPVAGGSTGLVRDGRPAVPIVCRAGVVAVPVDGVVTYIGFDHVVVKDADGVRATVYRTDGSAERRDGGM